MRRTSALLSAVALAAALTACAPGGEGQSPGGEGDVTITYLSSTILESPEKDLEQAAIDEFNALDNGITVKVEGIAANDMMEKFTALATANDMPDFYMSDIKNVATLTDMGLAEDVSTVFDADYLSSFTPDALAGYTVDGVVRALPWFTTPQGIVYRTDLFDAAGAAVPTTWDELVATAKKLTSGDQYGIALVGTKDASGAGRFQYVLRNFGVNEFTQGSDGTWATDVGSDEFVAALTAFTNLYTVDKVVPPGVIETDYASAVSLLSSGQAAMLITGSNAIGAITSKAPDLKGKLGSFPIPAVKRAVNSQTGFGFYVSPTSEHKAAVAEFLEFFNSKDKSVEYAQATGRLSMLTEGQADPAAAADPALAGFLEALTKGEVFVLPTIPNFSEANDIYGEAYQSVFTGVATPEQAAARAAERAQALVQKANEG